VRTLFATACVVLCVACDQTMDLHFCDIRQADCREDIFLAVQNVRGTVWDTSFDRPPMRVISKDQYRSELDAQTAAAGKQPSRFDYFTPAYKRFALVDPEEASEGATDFAVEFYAAYYDNQSDNITIIDRGDDTKLPDDDNTLAHELTHAAQARDIGFGVIDSWGRTIDNVNAREALVEGEADLYANLVVLLALGRGAQEVDWNSYYAKGIADTREKIAEDPSPWRVARSGLRYVLGAQYLTSAYLKQGPLGVRRAFEHHPSSTRRVMGQLHGPLDTPETPWSCATPAPPSDYKLIVATTLGAWAVYAFATRFPGNDDDAAWAYGQQWAGDEFAIYANADNTVAVSWRIQLRDADGAAAFAQAAAGIEKITLLHAVDGTRISFAAADDLTVFADRDLSKCATP
jgi:hypothetical protein